MDHNMLW